MSYPINEVINAINLFPIGIVLLEEDLTVVYINKYAKQLVNNTDIRVIKKAIAETLADSQSNGAQSPTFKDFEISINNTVIYFYLLLARKEKQNNYLCLLSTSKINMLVSDIKVIEHQMNDILNTSYDGFVVTDKDLITRKINTAYINISGADPSKLISKHASEFIKQGIVQDLAVEKSYNTKQRVFMIQPYPKNKIALVTTTPLLDEYGEVIMFVSNVRDMTTLYKMQEELKTRSANNKDSKKSPNVENNYYSKIVYRSDTMSNIMLLLQQISKVDSNIVIYGESGVGKGLFARTIHELSNRHNGPFIKVNCGAIPENLIESELFGYEHGAFTGAQKGGKYGLVQAADKGTIFLDEIGESPYTLQTKMLEFLQDGEFTKVGGTKPIKVDVRVIAATNKDLSQLMNQDKFRKDLYYRLNVMPITIPPLRERPQDIPLLIEHYSSMVNQKYNLNKFFSSTTVSILTDYAWPGNIRELQHLIEASFISSFKNEISYEDILPLLDDRYIIVDSGKTKDEQALSYKESIRRYEKKLLMEAINKFGSVKKAAEVLEINPSTIWRKL